MRLACAGLFSWLEEGATIVTPTPLLASVAAEQFSKHQLARGIESWQRPSIISIGAWLTSRWQEARYNAPNTPALLSPSQEHVLWQRIIEESNPDLFDVNATALIASRAARLMREWFIPAEGDAWNNHEDARQFQQWCKRFDRECAERGWITRADLWRLLPQWLANGDCTSETTVFAAFSITTPAFDCIRQALGHFAHVERGAASKSPDRIQVRPFPDWSAELDNAARWARSTFEQHRALSIGIIVPGLRAQRSVLERIFGQVFYPSAAAGRAVERSQFVFHINAAGAAFRHSAHQ